MPYGMPSIFGNFAGMGKWAFALFVNLRARALRALDFWPTGGQKRARACPFPSLLGHLRALGKQSRPKAWQFPTDFRLFG